MDSETFVFTPTGILQRCLPYPQDSHAAVCDAQNECRSCHLDQTYPVDITCQWRKDWNSASVVNSHIVDDRTIWTAGFGLPRWQWSLLNHIRTVRSVACRKRWWQADSDLCACGEPETMSHIVDAPCAVERDVRSGRGSIRASARARMPTKKRIISNNSYAHDDQGDNPGQENRGLDSVLYKLTVRLWYSHICAEKGR